MDCNDLQTIIKTKNYFHMMLSYDESVRNVEVLELGVNGHVKSCKQGQITRIFFMTFSISRMTILTTTP